MPCGIARQAVFDQLMIFRKQEIFAQEQGVRGEIVERHAANFRRQGTNDLGKRIQRLAGSGFGGFGQLARHDRQSPTGGYS